MATAKKKSNVNRDSDLPDSNEDKKKLQPDEGTLDLPDVKDIPGQEHIHVPRMSEFADTTISSDDEEGTRIFNDASDTDAESNVTNEERSDLSNAAETTGNVTDDKNLKRARLDERDDEGELLNERTDMSGRDLDVPGSEDDDADEDIGEEDEENNSYSLDGEDEDDSDSKGES